MLAPLPGPRGVTGPEASRPPAEKLAPHWKGPCWGTSGRQAQSSSVSDPRAAPQSARRLAGRQPPTGPRCGRTGHHRGDAVMKSSDLGGAVLLAGGPMLCTTAGRRWVSSTSRPADRDQGHHCGRAGPTAGPRPAAEEGAGTARRGRGGTTGLGRRECGQQSLAPRGPPQLQAQSFRGCAREQPASEHPAFTRRPAAPGSWGLSPAIAKQGSSS